MYGNTSDAAAESEGVTLMSRKRIRYIGPETMKIPSGFFCVRKEWQKASTQIGLFKSLDMAINCVDHNPEYSVFDDAGKRLYGRTIE